jgi:hypothetical protein
MTNARMWIGKLPTFCWHKLTFIETMPLGDIGVDRIDQYLPLGQLRKLSKAAGRAAG